MTVKELESQVAKLGPRELQEFRSWFERFDAQAWDAQLESDVQTGKLDRLAEKALQEYKDGKCTDL